MGAADLGIAISLLHLSNLLSVNLLVVGMVLSPCLEIAIGSSWFEITHSSGATASVLTPLRR